jgi:hypothetical protein
MCAASAECRTVMTVVLTVMSGKDPHTIIVTCIGMVSDVGILLVWSFRSSCHSGLCGRFDVALRGEQMLALQ